MAPALFNCWDCLLGEIVSLLFLFLYYFDTLVDEADGGGVGVVGVVGELFLGELHGEGFGFVPGGGFGEPKDGAFDALGGGGDGAVSSFGTRPGHDVSLGIFNAGEGVFGAGLVGVDKVAARVHIFKNLIKVDDGAALIDTEHDALGSGELVGRVGDEEVVGVDGVAGKIANLDFEALHLVVGHAIGTAALSLYKTGRK